MIARLGKYERRTFLLFLLILTIFVVIGSSAIYIDQRQELMRQASLHAEREIELIGKLITEALIKSDYVTVEKFISQWARERPDLVEAKLTTANGFVLAHQVRALPTQYRMPLRQQIAYGDRGSVTMDMVWDVTSVHQSLNRLLIILAAIPAVVVATLLLFLWWVLRHTLLQPLQSELEKSEHYNRMLFEQSPIGLALCRLNGKLVDINPAYARIIGRSVEETLRLSYWDITPESYTADEQRQLESLKTTGRYGPYEKEYIHKDGHRVPVQLQGLLLEKDGEQMIWSSVEDITEQKRTEETVRNIAAGVSAQTGEAFFQSLVVHLARIFDAEYTFIGLVNEQRPNMIDTVALCIHGEVVDNLSYELAHTPCKHVVDGNCDELQAYPRDIQRLFPDDPMLVEMGAHSYVGAPLADASGKPIGLIVVMDNKPMESTDRVETVLKIFATRAAAEMERLRADQALLESQKMLQLVLDSIPVRVFWKDRKSVYLGCNQHFAKDAGLESPEQIVGRNDFDLGWRQQAELYQSDDQQVLRSGVPKLNYEEPQTRPDGTRLWLQTSKIPLRGLDGNIFGVMGVYEDITERKQVKERETSLGQILDGSLNEIYIFDADTLQFVQVNRGAIMNLGYTMEELQRLTPVDLKPEFTRTSFTKLLAPLRNGEKEKIRFSTTHQRKDGSLYPVEVHLQLSSFESAPAFVAIILDVSERRQAEEALRRSQKMEAIGQLSGGIAHDFNNQLGVIIGYLDFLKNHLPEGKKPRHWVDTASKATLRCMDLTRQLLAFSRGQTKEKTLVDLNATFKELETMIARSLTPEVEVEYFLADELWQTEIDPGEFQDAILNLVINARDAMPGGGKLLIETSNKHLGADFAALHPEFETGDYVQLMLSDTGTGMDKETLEHVFEPFFTTKPEGQGTGLGLAMVYGFVKRFGGYIKVYSEPGVGTTLRLYLPRSTASESASVQNAREAELPTGSETILVVDDETDLLQLADQYLSDLGYRTYLAETTAQALEILGKEQEIDLLFSDVVMPGGMNGYELAQQATELRPNLKVLLTSGFTAKTLAHNGLARFSTHLLSKPYRKDDLAQRIRLVLDEALGDAENLPAARGTKDNLAGRTILVIDDEEDVRELFKLNLERLGCKTVSAGNGDEAVALYRQSLEGDETIDAIILDLTLPGDINGNAIAEKIRALDPQAKIIVASGHTEGSEMTHYQDYGFNGALEKNFNREKIKQLLEQVLTAG